MIGDRFKLRADVDRPHGWEKLWRRRWMRRMEARLLRRELLMEVM